MIDRIYVAFCFSCGEVKAQSELDDLKRWKETHNMYLAPDQKHTIRFSMIKKGVDL